MAGTMCIPTAWGYGGILFVFRSRWPTLKVFLSFLPFQCQCCATGGLTHIYLIKDLPWGSFNAHEEEVKKRIARREWESKSKKKIKQKKKSQRVGLSVGAWVFFSTQIRHKVSCIFSFGYFAWLTGIPIFDFRISNFWTWSLTRGNAIICATHSVSIAPNQLNYFCAFLCHGWPVKLVSGYQFWSNQIQGCILVHFIFFWAQQYVSHLWKSSSSSSVIAETIIW